MHSLVFAGVQVAFLGRSLAELSQEAVRHGDGLSTSTLSSPLSLPPSILYSSRDTTPSRPWR